MPRSFFDLGSDSAAPIDKGLPARTAVGDLGLGSLNGNRPPGPGVPTRRRLQKPFLLEGVRSTNFAQFRLVAHSLLVGANRPSEFRGLAISCALAEMLEAVADTRWLNNRVGLG
jgi:hypothetical protein